MTFIIVIFFSFCIYALFFLFLRGEIDKMFCALHNSIFRKKIGASLMIPYVLQEFEEKKLEFEKIVIKIKSWEPKIVSIKKIDKFEYIAMIPEKLLENNEMLLNQIDEICKTSKLEKIIEIFQKAKLSCEYPVVFDTPPPPIKLDNFGPINGDIEKPSIKIPYYKGFWKCINPFLTKVYAKEIYRFNSAQETRDELIDLIEKTNDLIQVECSKANERWQKATDKYNDEKLILLNQYNINKNNYEMKCQRDHFDILDIEEKYLSGSEDGVVNYYNFVLKKIVLPSSIPKNWNLKYTRENRILVLEHQFPDVAKLLLLKKVKLKYSTDVKPANQKEAKAALSKLFPALCIRLAYEVAIYDKNDDIRGIAINGWVDFIDKSTGKEKKAYCASLFISKEEILKIHLENIDPIIAFRTFKGINTGSAYEIVPILPVICLSREDPRFISSKEVLNKLSQESNLAVMDWEDFEHLVRDLFEKEFSGVGAEVRITQASRDLGVDAVIFDPDPIRGGKIIIQAKRYTNTVDVSAVRELYGTVINEGANKGILVTTSHFGLEAYKFIKAKPITLIDGNGLLGLFNKHGYKFCINLNSKS